MRFVHYGVYVIADNEPYNQNRTQDQMMVLMLNVVVLMLFGVFGYPENSHDGTQGQMMV